MQSDMATSSSSSKPLVWPKNQREIWLSGNGLQFQAFSVCPRPKSCGFMWRSETRKTSPQFLVRACEWEQNIGDSFGTSEEDQNFVSVLREAQPYISIHRDSIFVLLISAEIIASPHLDYILKVCACPSL